MNFLIRMSRGSYKKKRCHGFSLVEQVIVLTIVSLMSIMAVVSFTDFTVKQKRRSGIEVLYGDLVRIRNYAMSGYAVVKDRVPIYYSIRFIGENSYEVVALYDEKKNDETIIESRAFSDSLKFDVGDISIFSKVPDGSLCRREKDFQDLNCQGRSEISLQSKDMYDVEKSKIYIDHSTGTLSVIF